MQGVRSLRTSLGGELEFLMEGARLSNCGRNVSCRNSHYCKKRMREEERGREGEREHTASSFSIHVLYFDIIVLY